MISRNLIESSYLACYLLLNAVDISDYKIFPIRDIQNSPSVFHSSPPGNGEALLPILNQIVPANAERPGTETIDQFLERNGTVAFLVIKNDKVSMSSGLKYNAHGFFPWNDEPRVYYSLDLRQLARHAQSAEPPGVRFHYNNYNLVLLGMVLERVTGSTVSAYLQDKIWKPLGMEYPASWSLDSQHSGMEKMESGLNACAIDFAKFGRLYLRRGEWNGKQIVPENWVVESTTVEPDSQWTNYKYLWWILHSGKGRFMAVGNLGQFIFVAPDKDCIIVRLGRGKPQNWQKVYPQLFGSLVEVL